MAFVKEKIIFYVNLQLFHTININISLCHRKNLIYLPRISQIVGIFGLGVFMMNIFCYYYTSLCKNIGTDKDNYGCK